MPAPKLGASIAHIHVREDKEVDGVMQIGYKSMSLQKFTEAVEKTRALCKKEGVDIIINLTTSGGEYEDYKRLQHLSALKPEMCSFDPNTLNWSNSYIFENSPRFLNKLAEEVVKEDVKPEFEIFDTGHHRLRQCTMSTSMEHPPATPICSSSWALAAPCPAPPRTWHSWWAICPQALHGPFLVSARPICP